MAENHNTNGAKLTSEQTAKQTAEQTAKLTAKLIVAAAEKALLRRAVLSVPDDDSVKKATLTPVQIGGRLMIQYELFTSDNKAHHRNFSDGDISGIAGIVGMYSHVNILTAVGDAEYKRSKSGNSTVIGGDRLAKALNEADGQDGKRIVIGGNNKQKNYILDGSEPFLKLLEVSDANGRVHDKKQPKFRQINRFLELVRDIEKNLPSDGVLNIADLCCGKSYLSFAVYHYFAIVRRREVRMCGVDLKSDVIMYCNQVSEKLGWSGLRFCNGDIKQFDFGGHVNLVVSLHACDIATDIVLEKAVAWDADVILSTPCCHHELNKTLNCPTLDFIADHSMLRQKLCEAATDALRLKMLEAHGYNVLALELIDPEETPKNIMLRGVRKKHFDMNSDEAIRLSDEYLNIKRFLTGGQNGTH